MEKNKENRVEKTQEVSEKRFKFEAPRVMYLCVRNHKLYSQVEQVRGEIWLDTIGAYFANGRIQNEVVGICQVREDILKTVVYNEDGSEVVLDHDPMDLRVIIKPKTKQVDISYLKADITDSGLQLMLSENKLKGYTIIG